MKAKQKKNKRLNIIATLFIISVIIIAIGVLCLVMIDSQGDDGRVTLSKIGSISIVIGYIIFMISCLLNRSYRKECLYPGKFSTFIFVLTCIFIYPVFFITFLILLFAGRGGDVVSESDKLKKVTIVDEKDKVHYLTQTYAGSNEFRDQDNNLWKTYDGGATFELVEYGAGVDVEATDEEGNEKTLKRTYSDFMTVHYEDKDGEEYKSYDNGQTFEHVLNNAKVTDADGNEYSLKATFSGSDRFMDQNGDEWMTYDGGKTFERI